MSLPTCSGFAGVLSFSSLSDAKSIISSLGGGFRSCRCRFLRSLDENGSGVETPRLSCPAVRLVLLFGVCGCWDERFEPPIIVLIVLLIAEPIFEPLSTVFSIVLENNTDGLVDFGSTFLTFLGIRVGSQFTAASPCCNCQACNNGLFLVFSAISRFVTNESCFLLPDEDWPFTAGGTCK